MVNKFMEILKRIHGDDLNLNNNVYYLFLKGGLFSIYFDEDEKQIKVQVELLPDDKTFVYFSDWDIEDVMGDEL